MTLYVSNLSPDATREKLLNAFRAHGEVASVDLPADRMKDGRAFGAHRGYAFVVMGSRAEATAARAALDGKGMSVQIARPRRTPHYVS